LPDVVEIELIVQTQALAAGLSPVLHLAAYRALGLAGWTYDRIECDADRLPSLVGSLGPAHKKQLAALLGELKIHLRAQADSERTPQ